MREAFIKLADAGLFEVLPQRGAFVRKISLKAVRDARCVREAIELAVLREAVGRLSPDFFATARALVADQRAAVTGNDLERFMGLDDAFHRAFAVAIDRERGDTAAAEAAMRTHLTEMLAALEPLRERRPDLFEPDER